MYVAFDINLISQRYTHFQTTQAYAHIFYQKRENEAEFTRFIPILAD